MLSIASALVAANPLNSITQNGSASSVSLAVNESVMTLPSMDNELSFPLFEVIVTLDNVGAVRSIVKVVKSRALAVFPALSVNVRVQSE